MQKYKFHVSGTHCASCKIFIEDVLGEQDFVKNVYKWLDENKIGRAHV